jgi:hypothetical protein
MAGNTPEMKVALVQVACPASTGNVDFTDASVSSDLVGAFFFGGIAATNDSTAANAAWSFGATDLTGNVCIAYDGRDNVTGATSQGLASSTKAVQRNSGSGSGVVAAYSSTLSNGVRMNYSAVTSGALTSALLISGSDTAMKVGSVQYGTSDVFQVVTHGLGGTPDVLIVFVAGNSTGTDVGAQAISAGFWDRTTTNCFTSALRFQSGANPTSGNAYMADVAIGKSLANGSVTNTHTLVSVGATTFTLQRPSTGTSDFVPWIALRGTGARMVTKAAMVTTPLATGNSTLISGMSGAPQVILTLPTRLQTANALQTDDTTGSYGFGVACNHDGTTTQYASCISTMQDNVATSVSKHMASNTTGLGVLDNTGAYTVKSTVNSWDSGGATLNYSAVNASALEVIYLAFGQGLNPSTAWLRA